MKAAFHARGPAAGPEPDRAEVEPAAIERVTDWVGARFPGFGAALGGVEPCIYTNTADERFVLERPSASSSPPPATARASSSLPRPERGRRISLSR